MTSIPLNQSHPHLIAQWHPKNEKDISQYSHGSGRKVWWMCSADHEWLAVVSDRSQKNSRCPYCCGVRPIVGLTDLATVSPILASQWSSSNLRPPSEYLPKSHALVLWECPNNPRHRWEAKISDRQRKNNNCPYCSGNRVAVGESDLVTTRPDLADHWHPRNTLNPVEVSKGSDRAVWWLCEAGHESLYSIKERAINGCTRCSARSYPKVEQMFMDKFGEVYPDTIQHCRLDIPWRTRTYMHVDLALTGTIILEYDGSYWHRNKLEIDTQKTTALLNSNLTVIRIREDGLPHLNLAHQNLLQISMTWDSKYTNVQPTIDKIISWLDT